MIDSAQKSVVETYYLPAGRSTREQIQAAAELIRSEKLAAAVLETMPGGSMVLDSNRQIVASNQLLCSAFGLPGPESTLGYRPGELLGCRVPDTAPGGCGTGEECRYCGLVNTVVQSIKTGKTTKGECQISLKNGDALELAVAATAHNIDGNLFVFVGLHDISGEKRRQVLERTFFHDIMNTAGGVLGILQCLKEDLASIEGAELAAKSYALTRNLIEEIEAQRQLLAAEKGDLVIEKSIHNIRTIVEDTVSLYRNHQVCRGRTLTIRRLCDASIETDAGILRRILGNMIKNALEATPNGGHVVVEALEADSSYNFQVTNPGVIPKSIQMQLFKRSFSTKGAGRGIGTYSMKLLGERILGGELTFSSDQTVGTRFTFRHPRSVSSTVKKTPELNAAPHKAEQEPRKLHILVAEDNQVNQLVARKLMEKIGWNVTIAQDGKKVLDLLDEKSFDVILMDVHMPVMDGLEATRKIRSLNSNVSQIPIFAATASSDNTELNECLTAGMNDVVQKPLRLEELQKKILEL